MKHISVGAVLLFMAAMAAPGYASPLFSGTDSMDYDVIGVRPYVIQGTNSPVMLIQSRYPKTGDYVVMLRSMAAATNKQLIAEVRFRDGEQEQEPYATWLDSCFVNDGTLCNQKPGHAEKLTLANLLEKVANIIKNHPSL
jgi:hypothetical protein